MGVGLYVGVAVIVGLSSPEMFRFHMATDGDQLRPSWSRAIPCMPYMCPTGLTLAACTPFSQVRTDC